MRKGSKKKDPAFQDLVNVVIDLQRRVEVIEDSLTWQIKYKADGKTKSFVWKPSEWGNKLGSKR